MLGSERMAALRLFDLFDTLVAMRWNVGTSTNGAGTFPTEKIAAVRLLLDHAIKTTKIIIGDTKRPV